jgi:hypothetical protein
VTAGLPALRDDYIHPTPDRAPGLLGAAHRMQHKPSGVVHGVDIALGIAPEERDDPQAGRKRLIDSMVLVRGENEVASKRAIGQRRRFTNQIARVVSPPEPHRAEAAGVGDRGGKAGICSQRRRNDREVDPQQLAQRRAGAH